MRSVCGRSVLSPRQTRRHDLRVTPLHQVRVLGVSELKMRSEESLDAAITHDSMGRLSNLDRGGCDVALLKVASPYAAAAALGQLKIRNGDTRLSTDGTKFQEGAPALPFKLEASSKDPRVVKMTVTGDGEMPADEEAAQLASASECYFLGVHRLQLAMIHSSHSVRARKGIKPLMPQQQAQKEQLHAAKMEVHRNKLKIQKKEEMMLKQRDQGGSRSSSLKAFTKRDLVFAFRTWQVSARCMCCAECARSAHSVRGVRTVCTARGHTVSARCEHPPRTWQGMGRRGRITARWERLTQGAWYLIEHAHPWTKLPSALGSVRLPGGGSFVLREAAWALVGRAEWASCLEMWGATSLGYVPSEELTKLSLPKLNTDVARGDKMYWRELRQVRSYSSAAHTLHVGSYTACTLRAH